MRLLGAYEYESEYWKIPEHLSIGDFGNRCARARFSHGAWGLGVYGNAPRKPRVNRSDESEA